MQNRFEEFKFTVFIFILLFVSFGFQSIGYSQNTKPVENNQSESQDDIIRVDTNLITVPVSVLDRDGRYVTNLKKEDFQIFEDNIEQEVSFFEPVEQPFTVFLLLDRSGSMSKSMAQLTQAANAFVSQLRPEDRVIAATFGDNVDVLFKATKAKDLKRGFKLRQNRNDRYTMLFDAVDYALEKLKKVPGRKAIIVFSDGFGGGTFSSAKDNLREAEEGEALIYTVQFDTLALTLPSYVSKKTYSKSIEAANNYMRALPKITGGRDYQIEDIGDLEKTFRSIAEELGQQYSLGYYPKQPEAGQKRQVRKIKVKVNQPNLAVKARASYIVEPLKK